MIIEVDIVTLEVRVNGAIAGTTTSERMHNCRDYAREHLSKRGNSSLFTILDGKIASQHDITYATAERIVRYLEKETK